MPYLVHRFAFIKMRRVLEVFLFSCFVIILLTIASKWSSSSTGTDNHQHYHGRVNTPANPFLPNNQIAYNQNENTRLRMEKSINGQPDLPKYIHLDLKGAPPQAAKFYPGFFSFIEKLQIGVKGVLIEYEDMLPLQGRFVNVRERCRSSIDGMECSSFRLRIVLRTQNRIWI